jgi:branched-chain amino acid transport system substrate-binding protein
MKVGMLFPMSNVYPGMGADFIDGLNAFLKHKQQLDNITLVKEGIGFGGTEKDVYLKAEQLLIRDDVDILLAYIDEKVAEVLYPLSLATGKLIFVINPGANYPANWIAQPAVIRLNLQHAFLCWLTGAWATEQPVSNAALATSYYDCGYLHAAAMVNRFMQAGGNMQFNFINNKPESNGFSIEELTGFLKGQNTCNNLLCIFDESPAALFYEQLALYPGSRSLQLFVSPMMLQPKALHAIADPAPYTVNGYLQWNRESENADNLLFLRSCSRPVSIFSLLGWETALVLEKIAAQGEITPANGEALVQYLKNNTLQSPRGALELDSETQCYLAPAVRYSLHAGSTTASIKVEEDIKSKWKTFSSAPIDGAVTGWTNTYLCY